MNTMTGRERLLRTLHQQPADVIPVSPFIHVNYIKEFFGDSDVDYVSQTPEVYRHFGFDVMHRNCSPVYTAYGPAARGWEFETARQQDGRDETTTTTIHTPRGSVRAVEALRWTYEYDAEASAVEYPIKDEADLDLMQEFQPPAEPAIVSDILRAREAVGEDGVVAPWIQGAFNLAAFYYRKVDDLLVDAVLRPAFYDRLMSYCLNRYLPWVQQIIDAGVDVLCYAGNIANGKMVGPDFYRRHILPYEKRFVDFIQGQGVAVLYHNCGYARKLLPVYPSLGLRAYESLTPVPYGDTVLSEALDIFAGKTTLLGNIDQITLLREGTQDEIAACVREVLDTAHGRGHFILATTDYFNENTPHDNIHYLADAARRYPD